MASKRKACSNCASLRLKLIEKENEIKQLNKRIENLTNFVLWKDENSNNADDKSNTHNQTDKNKSDGDSDDCMIVEEKNKKSRSEIGNSHDYIYDKNYQMYYSVSTGYYYDEKSGLMYEPKSCTYYRYDYDKKVYEKVSDVELEKLGVKNDVWEFLKEANSCEVVVDQVNSLNLDEDSSKTETATLKPTEEDEWENEKIVNEKIVHEKIVHEKIVHENSNTIASEPSKDDDVLYIGSTEDWRPAKGSKMTVTDIVKQVVDEHNNMSDYVFDEKYQMYYSQSTGYYYDSVRNLLYDPNSGSYYFYDADKQTYEFYYQTEPKVPDKKKSEPKESPVKPVDKEKLKNRELYWKKKLGNSKETVEASGSSAKEQSRETLETSKDSSKEHSQESLKAPKTSAKKTRVKEHSEKTLEPSKTHTKKTKINEHSRETLEVSEIYAKKIRATEYCKEILEASKSCANETSTKEHPKETLEALKTVAEKHSKETLEALKPGAEKHSKETLEALKPGAEKHSKETLEALKPGAEKHPNETLETFEVDIEQEVNQLPADLQENSKDSSETLETATDSDENDIYADVEEEFSSPEDGEVFSSDEDSKAPFCIIRSPIMGSCLSAEDSLAPSIRAIVENSEKLQIGSLILITCSGGIIGRDKDHPVYIPDLSVSKEHAEIKYYCQFQSYTIEDLGSQNGTFINEKRLSEPRMKSDPCFLNHGDKLSLGLCKLLLHIHAGHDTCDGCEPGQVLAKLSSLVGKNTIHMTSADREKSRREELRRIKKKYGLQASDFVRKQISIKIKGYQDKAELRRQTVGSDNPYEKTQEASVDVSMPESNKGYQMLKNMGWKEGQTLGTHDLGLIEPIPLRPWTSKAGLGSSEDPSTDAGSYPQQKKRNQKWVKAQERYFQLTLGNDGS